MPIITCLALLHSVFSPKRTQTASNTRTTIGGGFVNPLISAISFLLILDSASSASLRAGSALSNSPYASSAIILISKA
jgi:hypothetical protein